MEHWSWMGNRRWRQFGRRLGSRGEAGDAEGRRHLSRRARRACCSGGGIRPARPRRPTTAGERKRRRVVATQGRRQQGRPRNGAAAVEMERRRADQIRHQGRPPSRPGAGERKRRPAAGVEHGTGSAVSGRKDGAAVCATGRRWRRRGRASE